MQEIAKHVHNALNGDQEGFEKLYQATSKAVYFTCLSLVKNRTDAEDLMQDVYITAFTKLSSLSQPEKFTPWIKRIAVNKCKDFLVKKGIHPEYSIDSEGAVEELIDENILPEEYAENKEKRRTVMEIMQKSLSDVQYQTVILFYFDDMSMAEIAQIMDCPEGTVKYRLNAARSKIKKGVLSYEHRTDDKMYTFAGAPFLARLLIAESADITVPAVKMSNLLPVTVAKTAVNVGKKAFPGTLKGKLIVGAATVAIVGGAVTAVVIANRSGDPDDISDSYISESISDSAPDSNTDDTDDNNVSDSLSAAALNSSAEENEELPTEDYLYEDIPGGIRITKYLGNDVYLTIPAKIDGKKVLELDDGENSDFVFYNFGAEPKLKEITLPEGLEHIGYSVFSYLSHLEAVHFPESLESIGAHAFLDCTNLERIELPDCEINFDSMFENCTSLKDVTLPESATELFLTFSGCTALESITIPASTETLDYTFDGCTALKNLTFAEDCSLTEIGLSMCRDCSSLESIVLPNGIEQICDSAFERCTSLKSVSLPDSLEDIGIEAFAGCVSLEEIVLPDGIRYVHPTSFKDCGKIRIIFRGKSYSAEEISELLTLTD